MAKHVEKSTSQTTGEGKSRHRKQEPQKTRHEKSTASVVENEHEFARENTPVPTRERLDEFPIGIEALLHRLKLGDFAEFVVNLALNARTLLGKTTGMTVLRIRHHHTGHDDAEKSEEEKALENLMKNLVHLRPIFYDYSNAEVKAI